MTRKKSFKLFKKYWYIFTALIIIAVAITFQISTGAIGTECTGGQRGDYCEGTIMHTKFCSNGYWQEESFDCASINVGVPLTCAVQNGIADCVETGAPTPTPGSEPPQLPPSEPTPAPIIDLPPPEEAEESPWVIIGLVALVAVFAVLGYFAFVRKGGIKKK